MQKITQRLTSCTLAPLFMLAVLAGCDSAQEKEVQIERHIAQYRNECPNKDALEPERLRMVLAVAYNAGTLKRLADERVSVCLDRAMTAIKPVPPYNYPVFAIYYPPAGEKGAFLRLWDDGNPPKKLRMIMNEDSIIRHPAEAFRGVVKILNRDKPWLKPENVNVAIGNAGCGYNCTGITWYPPEKQPELFKLNPGLDRWP